MNYSNLTIIVFSNIFNGYVNFFFSNSNIVDSFIEKVTNYSGAPRTREVRAWAWAEPHSLVNLPIPENLVIT